MAATAGVWLMFGVAPCFAAAPADAHAGHDCPHCETEAVVVAPDCGVPAAVVPFADTSPDVQPALPANRPPSAAIVRILHHSAPLPAAPHERPVRQRYCRLLE